MKKYTIKDDLGNKKTVYADNLSHAIKLNDEASLATTINALVNDEKAAIDAYNVAIKNLEGSVDDTARQVLINIMKDERKHVENLYAILNNQVTEKNLKDSIHDDTFKESNNVYYKFERGYWHVLSIHNKTEMDHQDVMSLARKNNVMIEPYFKYDYHRTDKGGYYTDYKVKGKDKNAVIRFCETMNPIVKPLTFSDDIEDSKIVDAVQSAETYANTGWIENKLATDLINEGQKNDYDFDAVLKKFDSLSKQILAVVKNALDNARKEIVDYKSRY